VLLSLILFVEMALSTMVSSVTKALMEEYAALHFAHSWPKDPSAELPWMAVVTYLKCAVEPPLFAHLMAMLQQDTLAHPQLAFAICLLEDIVPELLLPVLVSYLPFLLDKTRFHGTTSI